MFSDIKGNMKKLVDFKAEDARFRTEKPQDFAEEDNSSIKSFNVRQFPSLRKGVQRLLSFRKNSPDNSALASGSSSRNTLHQPEISIINRSDLPKQQTNSQVDQMRGSKSTGCGQPRPSTPSPTPNANVKRTHTFPKASVPATSSTIQEDEEQQSNIEVEEQQKKNIIEDGQVRPTTPFFDVKRTLPQPNIPLSGRNEETGKEVHSRQLHQAVPFIELNQSEFKEKQNAALKLGQGSSGPPPPPPRRRQASPNSSSIMVKPHMDTIDLRSSPLGQDSKCKDTTMSVLNFPFPPTYQAINEDEIVKDINEKLTITSPPTNSHEYQEMNKTENPAIVKGNRQKSEVKEAPFIKEQVPSAPLLIRKPKLGEQSRREEIGVTIDENVGVNGAASNTKEKKKLNEYWHYRMTTESPGNEQQTSTPFQQEYRRTDSDPSYNQGDIMTNKRKEGPSMETNQRKRTAPFEMPGCSIQIGQTLVSQPTCQQVPPTELLYRDAQQTNDNEGSPYMASLTSLDRDSSSSVIPSNSEDDLYEEQDAPESSHQQHAEDIIDPELHESFVKTTLERISSTMNEVRELEEEMRSFPGTNTNDQDYLYLDEVMMRSLIKLDNIETRNDQEIRKERKEGIRYIQQMMARLEQKLQENQGNMRSILKNCSSEPASSSVSTEEQGPADKVSNHEDVARKWGNVSDRHECESVSSEYENLEAKEESARDGDEHQRKAIEYPQKGNRHLRKDGAHERGTDEHTRRGDEYGRKGEERVPKTEESSPQPRTDDNTSQGGLPQL